MSKKNTEETQNSNTEESFDPTKPVRTGRKVFKDNPKPKKEGKKVEPEVEESIELEDTTPRPKKVRRAKWIWLGILIMIVIAALGAGTGYVYAMQVRIAEENNQKLTAATTQYVLAEKDQQNGNLDMARQRLEYILTVYPEYPGLTEKLKDVIVAISLNKEPVASDVTAEPVVTAVPTKDTTVVSELLVQAQNQLVASDWQGLLDTVKKMRNIDPTYEAVKVDSLYYFALRYNAINKINSGHLEVGLYYFSLAAAIAPLDAGTTSSIVAARDYQFAASYFGYNPQRAAEEFQRVASSMPNMIDTSGITAKQRYVSSLEGYGDYLMEIFDYCGAITQYETANNITSSETLIAKFDQAQQLCLNPAAATEAPQ